MRLHSTSTTLIIRSMRLDDLPAVHEVDRTSFSMPWPESAYRYELLENPQSMLWVAEALLSEGKPKVVGSIVIWLILDEAHIATLSTHPDYRDQGIAKELLATALEAAVRRGFAKALLEVRAHNTIAQNLYHKFGFEVVGRRPRYYHDNKEDALLMTLDFLSQTGRGQPYLDWLVSGVWKNGRSGRA